MSQPRFVLTSPQVKNDTCDINWTHCFICQNATDTSSLTSPGRGRGRARINASRSASVDIPGGSHATFPSNLFTWQNSQCSDRLPCPLLRRIHLYASEASLQRTFLDNNAVFHKKCVSFYTGKRLQDVIKKRHINEEFADANMSSPKKT